MGSHDSFVLGNHMHAVSPPITSLVYYIATYYSKDNRYCQQQYDIVDLEYQYIIINFNDRPIAKKITYDTQ